MKKLIIWLRNPLLREERTLLFVWTVSAIIFPVVKFLMGKYNNYKIFEHSFGHAVDGLSLYQAYPDEYYDFFLYGPIFGLLIAPFSLLPEWLGMIFWVVANTLFLFYAVKQLPLTHNQRIFVWWFSLCELMTAQGVQQFNISVTALVLLAFACIERKKDFWAAGAIMFGTFIKIYPIVGLAFFFFSRQKLKLTVSCIFWAAVFFVLPVVYGQGWDYVVSQYTEWIASLAGKDAANMFSPYQNVSLLGIVRKLSGSTAYTDLWLIVPGLILFFIPYLRVSQYKYLRFRMMLLANVLLFIVMFSSGSESSGYVIAMTGVALWFICSPSAHCKYNKMLMVTTLVVVGLSTTDLVPPFIRSYIILPYVLKAWPCVLVWFTVVYEMIFLNFSRPAVRKTIF